MCFIGEKTEASSYTIYRKYVVDTLPKAEELVRKMYDSCFRFDVVLCCLGKPKILFCLMAIIKLACGHERRLNPDSICKVVYLFLYYVLPLSISIPD